MICSRARQVLDAWVDGELDAATSADIAAHVGQCAACAAVRDGRGSLRRRVREEAPYFSAPEALRHSVRRSLVASADPPPRRRAPAWWQAAALAGLCALLAGWGTHAWMSLAPDGSLPEQVVESHAASLRPGRQRVEVASLDRHVVKPWFQGKLDFAPLVRDLSAEGFVLEGARLDQVGARPAAAIVYRLRNHPVSLFVWRAAGTQREAMKLSSLRGYAVATWARDGLQLAAVSDAEARELERFAQLFEKESQ